MKFVRVSSPRKLTNTSNMSWEAKEAMVAAREGERTGYNKIRYRTIVTITRTSEVTIRTLY